MIAPWDKSDVECPLVDEWRLRLQTLVLNSPLDRKARDAALAHFEGVTRSITATAGRIGVKRETVTRRLERAHNRGWVVLSEAPDKAGTHTLPRVCRWRAWWLEPLRDRHTWEEVLTARPGITESVRATALALSAAMDDGDLRLLGLREFVATQRGIGVREYDRHVGTLRRAGLLRGAGLQSRLDLDAARGRQDVAAGQRVGSDWRPSAQAA